MISLTKQESTFIAFVFVFSEETLQLIGLAVVVTGQVLGTARRAHLPLLGWPSVGA